VLVGLSRKGFLGEITGRPIDERLVATVTADLIACSRGADIIRVHDVRAAVDSIRVREAFLKRERGYRGLAAAPQ
jgi:dihydropteroate synthase